MKLCGFHSSHDCSFAIIEDGIPIMHHERERFERSKMCDGDALGELFEHYNKYDDIKYFVHAANPLFQVNKKYKNSFAKATEIILKNEGRIDIGNVGHHQAHAANAFFSSNYDDALIITIDGGGEDQNLKGNWITTTFTIWNGKDNKITPIRIFPDEDVNLGGLWYHLTRSVFGLSVRPPNGGQQGTVMAMAALGDGNRYLERIENYDFPQWNFIIDYLNEELEESREKNRYDQTKFDIAASLQHYTEERVKYLVQPYMEKIRPKYVCLAGGVALNSVMLGKFYNWFPYVEEIYVPPAPYDAGLAMGTVQYIWHHEKDNPRIKWVDNFTPYTGQSYNEEIILSAMKEMGIGYQKVDDDFVIDLLNKQKIVAVYGGRSETGRRALGNRSILADPRDPIMKSKVNDKVKHRQWFRPFAPSILREDVKDWFVLDKNSPYMFIVLKFKEEMKNKVPAVVHADGSARLQTVTKNDNEWYYNFLLKWKEKTGIPMLLNTSFNDREPIVETPSHALHCFFETDIDFLYFYDYKILTGKREV